MFRVDRANKIAMPPALQALAPSYEHYWFVSAMFHVPIWIVRALRREDSGEEPDGRGGQIGEDEDGLSRVRVVMFSDPDEAMHVAGLDVWEWVSLYVMQLDRVTQAGEIALDRCLKINRCMAQAHTDPPGEMSPCFRITTTRGVIVVPDPKPAGEEPVQSETLWWDQR